MKTYTLNFGKASSPATYEQVEILKSFDNLKGCPSSSQMTKRLEEEEFEQILADLKAGEEVTIEG